MMIRSFKIELGICLFSPIHITRREGFRHFGPQSVSFLLPAPLPTLSLFMLLAALRYVRRERERGKPFPRRRQKGRKNGCCRSSSRRARKTVSKQEERARLGPSVVMFRRVIFESKHLRYCTFFSLTTQDNFVSSFHDCMKGSAMNT